MKNQILILILVFMGINAHAQLDRGKHVVGLQLPIMVNDMYYTKLAFDVSPNEKHYGISIVPSYAFVIEHNWLLGIQATLGVETTSYPNGNTFSSAIKETYTDLGIAPFTRYYVDVSKNKNWKIFGVAALELNTANSKYGYKTGVSTTGSSFTTSTGSLGGGIAWFGKKISIDASMSNTALRLGIYKVFSGKKK
jgi:uncharacterized membrane protein YgcG